MSPRIVDLSLPLMNFSMEELEFTPQITYLRPDEVARRIAKRYQVDLESIPGGTHLASELVSLSVHSGTHVDAPSHYGPRPDGKLGAPIDEVPLEWCCGEGVVVDLSSKQAGELISAAEIRTELDRMDHRLVADEILLIRTGWDRRYGSHDFATAHPGLSREACAWVLDQGVRTIGIDANSLDVPTATMVDRLKKGDADQFYQCHYLGREREYLQIEKLAHLEELPPMGFTVFAFPVSIRGASGGWTRAVAIVKDEGTEES